MLDTLSTSVSDLFEGSEDEVGLLLDDVGFRKKGRYSACVARQYLGCIGKRDTGQIAVVAGLSYSDQYCPISTRLFMPESWEQDHLRRKKCKIPTSLVHRSKTMIAFDMIERIRELGVKFDYVAFDAGYGASFQLLEALYREGINFIGDVHSRIKILTEEPRFYFPEYKPGQTGRRYKIYRYDEKEIVLSDYQQQLTDDQYQEITFRNATKAPLKASYHQKQVWIVIDKVKPLALKLKLIIRKDMDGTIKYSLTNDLQASLKTLAKRQGQRVFVERIFEEGKNQIGLGDYQVRSWDGFHKHLTLCFLAFYYMAEQKKTHQQDIKLTNATIRKLVAATIVSRWDNLDQTIELCLQQITHYQRQIRQNIKPSG